MGDLRTRDEKVYTMAEVEKHTDENDAWLVIDDIVYNITNFWKKHPGGQRVIMSFAGMDASAMYHLYHLRKEKTSDKYLKVYRKGTIVPESIPERKRLIDKDYTELTELCKKQGFFKANYLVEAQMMTQCIALILLSILTVFYFGTGWLPTLCSSVLLGLAWVTTLYVMHDFGHRAVTHDVTTDYFFQHIFTNLTLGFCTEFVQVYHNMHHTFPHKTGAVLKNEEAGKETKKKLSIFRILFNLCTTAPALFPYLWTIASIKVAIQKHKKYDVLTYILFHVWYFGAFWQLGLLKLAVHWIIARQIWSHVVFFTALANHIEVPTEFEHMTFFEYQVSCSINFTRTWLIHWAVGGQNEQIEHHLWPHMPRENLHKAAPYVKSLCKKWGIKYVEKGFFRAYYDVIDKLRNNPEASRPYDLWYQMMYRTS